MSGAGIGKLRLLLVVITLLVFAGLYIYQENKMAGAPGFPLDDAWIHCQFARNLAQGNGMSYNPGVPISGSTAPLWTIMMAGSYFVDSNLVWIPKIMGLALYLLSCVMAFKIILYILDDRVMAFVGALFLAMTSSLMWGALSGMEVMLSVVLTLAGIYLHMLYRRETGPKQCASTAVFALAALARPESMLLIFFALADSFVFGRVEKDEKVTEFIKRSFILLVLFFALLGPYFYFNASVSGGPFPSTFEAKRGGGILSLLSGGDLEKLRETFFMYPSMYLLKLMDIASKNNLLLFWLMFVGAGKIIVDAFRQNVKNRALLVPLTFFMYPICVGLIAPSKMGHDWMFRYMGNMTALYVIMGAVGLHTVISFFRSALAEFWVKKETAGRIAKGTLAVVVVTLLIALSIEEYEYSKFYALGVQNINTMHVRIGRWIEENSPSDAVLAVNDIGAIAFFSEREVIDLVGLVTPEILPFKERVGGAFDFVKVKKPDYVIIYPNWFSDFPQHEELTPVFEVTLDKNAVCGGITKVVYKTAWAGEQPPGE